MDNKQAALELGQKPVGQLLWQYALPAMVAMTASSLYNIIDRAFIGQLVGPEAIAGLGITFPLMNLSGAFGAGVGVGASTCISVKLGQKDYKTAEHTLGNTVTLNLIIGAAFMVVCLLFLDPILRASSAHPTPRCPLRRGVNAGDTGGQRDHPHVLRHERRAACRGQALPGGCTRALHRGAATFCWSLPSYGGSRPGIRGAALATIVSQSMALVLAVVEALPLTRTNCSTL